MYLAGKDGKIKVYSFADFGEMMPNLENGILEDEDLVLIKGSNSLGLNRVAKELNI